MAEKKKLTRIPATLSDVTTDWVAELLYKVLRVPKPKSIEGTHNGITLLKIKANPTSMTGFKESCHIKTKCSSQPDKTHQFLGKKYFH